MSDPEQERRERALAWADAAFVYTEQEREDRRFFGIMGRNNPHDLMLVCAGDRGRDAEVNALQSAMAEAKQTAADLGSAKVRDDANIESAFRIIDETRAQLDTSREEASRLRQELREAREAIASLSWTICTTCNGQRWVWCGPSEDPQEGQCPDCRDGWIPPQFDTYPIGQIMTLPAVQAALKGAKHE